LELWLNKQNGKSEKLPIEAGSALESIHFSQLIYFQIVSFPLLFP
jgi:hypothetical protein